jgi:adenylate cyclase
VNTAERMESYSLPGRIQVSEATQRLLEKSHRLDYRGEIDIEEKGKVRTWLLSGRLAPPKSLGTLAALV